MRIDEHSILEVLFMKVALAISVTMLIFSVWFNFALWNQTVIRPIWFANEIEAMQAASEGKK